MPGLIVSVRDAEEARIALENGADLIDVKEPSRGALGRADDAVIEAVLEVVAGRLPVSAALGELIDGVERPACADRLAFMKVGLAGLKRSRDWVERMSGFVPCVYGDDNRASAPPLREVVELFGRLRPTGLLIDTWAKDGSTLLDWTNGSILEWLAFRCRGFGIKLALAGSLVGSALETASTVGADWIAVRGAACEGGRDGSIRAERVRSVAALVHAARMPSWATK